MKEKTEELSKEKADKLAKEKADKLAKEKADKLAKEKADKLAKEKADKLAKEKADKLAKEKAEKLAKEKAEKLAKEKAEELAKEKADKLAKEKANKLAKDSNTDVLSTKNIENLSTDNLSADNLSADNLSADNLSADNLSADNLSADNLNADIPNNDNSSIENPIPIENTADESSSSGFSGSSSSFSLSGMGMLYREPASNVAAKELVTRNVVNGNHIRYDFQENSTCIIYIEYDAERTFLKTTTTVEELKNKSTLVSKRAPGRLYKYVNIWVGDKGGGLPTSLKNGSIGFKVEKAWISNSTANINESFVTLQWYNKSNTSWEPLYTEKTGEDNNYMYFKSTTPGFSSFAITKYTGELEKNGTQVGAKLQDTLTGLGGAGKVGLNGSANNSKAQEARSAAKILMAISLPLFLIFVGYLVIKKKI